MRGLQFRLPVRRVILVYVVLGSFWFFVSEFLVHRFLTGPAGIVSGEIISGLVFISGTTLLLFLLLSHSSDRVSNSEVKRGDSSSLGILDAKGTLPRAFPVDADESLLQSMIMTAKNFAVFRLRQDPAAPFALTPVFASPLLEHLWVSADLGDFTSWMMQVDEEDRQELGEKLAQCIDRTDGFEMIFRIVQRSPEDRRWLRCMVEPVAGAMGHAAYVDGVVTDETTRVLDNQRLLEYRDQLRSLVFQLATTEQVERQRIADFLHDETVQTLALVSMRLSDLQQDQASAEWRGNQYQIQDLLRRAIDDCRSLTIQLNPPVLERLGLLPALEGLADEFGDNHGIPCTFRWQGPDRRLERSMEGMVYRAVREMLVNVARHAGATSVHVEVAMEPDELRVSVADDGKGFDATRIGEDPGHISANGLFSIRERAAYLGGECRIQSAPGSGTQVLFRIPAAIENPVA